MKKLQSVKELFAKQRNGKKHLLCIFAHPDDESIRCGGTLARAKEEGVYTSVICVANGSKGHVKDKLTDQQLARVRSKELLKATKILGVKKLIQLNFDDGKIYADRQKIYQTLKKLVQSMKPSVIITHDPSGLTGHPDHISLSAIVAKICQAKFLPDLKAYYVTLSKFDKILLKMKSPNPIQIQNMQEPTHMISIKAYLQLKKKALSAHASQSLANSNLLPDQLKLSLQPYEYFHQINHKRKYRFSLHDYLGASLVFSPETPLVRL